MSSNYHYFPFHLSLQYADLIQFLILFDVVRLSSLSPSSEIYGKINADTS
jgi:hypothetical protein